MNAVGSVPKDPQLVRVGFERDCEIGFAGVRLPEVLMGEHCRQGCGGLRIILARDADKHDYRARS